MMAAVGRMMIQHWSGQTVGDPTPYLERELSVYCYAQLQKDLQDIFGGNFSDTVERFARGEGEERLSRLLASVAQLD